MQDILDRQFERDGPMPKKQKKTPLISLTIYLAKTGTTFPGLIARMNAFQVENTSVKLAPGTKARVYYDQKRGSVPKWVDYLEEGTETKLKLSTASISAALIIETSKAIYALTFGYGKFLLPDEIWDDTFGLRVSLNSIKPDKIRSVERQTFDALASQSKTQAAKAGSFEDFGIQVEKDVFRAVTGELEDQELGRTMHGIDSVHVTIGKKLEEIPAYLDKLFEISKSKSYVKRFPWVDKMREVKSTALKEQLDEEVIRHLRAKKLSRLWMAPPDLISWKGIKGFQYPGLRESISDLDVERFLATFRQSSDITLDALKHRRVFCVRDDDEPADHWTAYRCIYAEVDLGPNETYFLNNGHWYKISKDFVEETNRYYDEEVEKVDLGFFPLGAYSGEGAYNEAVANVFGLKLLDKDLVYADRKVEICDLFSKENQFIHVKRYSGSGTLSHLFAQGYVSARLFKSDAGFRKILNQKLAPNFGVGDSRQDPIAQNFTIVYAIISNEPGAKLTLPFFSRVNLMNTHKDLRMIGFKVALYKIPVLAGQ
jgi:uncharacterized protein (TIGR04141 family)